jgi:hypothetical protein
MVMQTAVTIGHRKVIHVMAGILSGSESDGERAGGSGPSGSCLERLVGGADDCPLGKVVEVEQVLAAEPW